MHFAGEGGSLSLYFRGRPGHRVNKCDDSFLAWAVQGAEHRHSTAMPSHSMLGAMLRIPNDIVWFMMSPDDGWRRVTVFLSLSRLAVPI